MEKSELEAIVQGSTSYRQVAKKLGTDHHGAKRAIEQWAIPVPHVDFGKRSLGYVGRSFNRLTIRAVWKGEKRRWFCRCDCDCGTQDVVKRLDGVLDGHVPSCGCAYLDRPSMCGAKNPAFKGCGELAASRVYWIKRGAERRGLQFAVSKEYLWLLFEKQGATCALSG